MKLKTLILIVIAFQLSSLSAQTINETLTYLYRTQKDYGTKITNLRLSGTRLVLTLNEDDDRIISNISKSDFRYELVSFYYLVYDYNILKKYVNNSNSGGVNLITFLAFCNNELAFFATSKETARKIYNALNHLKSTAKDPFDY